MDVRICAKCGHENRMDRSACSNCFAPLEGAAPAAGSSPTPRPVAMPQTRKMAPPPEAYNETPTDAGAGMLGGQPLGGDEPVFGQPPKKEVAANPYGAPPRPSRPPVMPEFSSAPAKKGANWGAIIFVLILLAGAGFGAWNYVFKPKPPEEVVKIFFTASTEGNYKKLKPYLSKASIEYVKKNYGEDEQQVSEKIKTEFNGASQVRGNQGAALDDIQFKPAVYEGNTAFVEFTSKDPMKQIPPDWNVKFGMVLVKEGMYWKIDLPQSETRLMSEAQKLFKKMFGSGFRMPPNGFAPGR